MKRPQDLLLQIVVEQNGIGKAGNVRAAPGVAGHSVAVPPTLSGGKASPPVRRQETGLCATSHPIVVANPGRAWMLPWPISAPETRLQLHKMPG